MTSKLTPSSSIARYLVTTSCISLRIWRMVASSTPVRSFASTTLRRLTAVLLVPLFESGKRSSVSRSSTPSISGEAARGGARGATAGACGSTSALAAESSVRASENRILWLQG
eukprot:CAMPEP_0202735604 /NCGR_PEP_ID=MMETSP1388-20130828/503_1 /ASSEMBLY_ACC=CAM_ASM_000864 /TAXON_ID=37098 /ORGANISM="Isochrysis sp, Strain CCMP1244" /LENGTH=112 /DNA_ID=CAMNT_0049402059 /DNA_START=219 /DNA_END=557 /DNA_ORIENTATION=+